MPDRPVPSPARIGRDDGTEQVSEWWVVQSETHLDPGSLAYWGPWPTREAAVKEFSANLGDNSYALVRLRGGAPLMEASGATADSVGLQAPARSGLPAVSPTPAPREWSLKILATRETRTCRRLWPLLVNEFVPARLARAYYRVADLTLCDVIGHDYTVESIYHDEGTPLMECSRCEEVNA